MTVLLKVIGSSPAWPNPGSAHSGYMLEHEGGRQLLLDCGPGVLARLREDQPWPTLDAIAITHFHLDHWGDLVPWVWGSMYRANGGPLLRPELWVHEGGRNFLEALGARLGFPDMFENAFRLSEYHAGEPFTVEGFEVVALRLPHYTLETYGFRVSADGATVAYSGDSGPSERLVDLARDADLFVCEATLANAEADGHPRGHLAVNEAVTAYEASGAVRLLLTHRPFELPLDERFEMAYDGLQIEITGR